MPPAGGRTSGLGPTSTAGTGSFGQVGAGIRLGKIASVSGAGTALLVLTLLEIGVQVVLRRSFKRAHGG